MTFFLKNLHIQHAVNTHSYHMFIPMSIFGTHQPVTGGCWKAPMATLKMVEVLGIICASLLCQGLETSGIYFCKQIIS